MFPSQSRKSGLREVERHAQNHHGTPSGSKCPQTLFVCWGNNMPHSQSSKPSRHLEHFLGMQRGDTKNILHPGFRLGVVHSAHPLLLL